MQHIDQVRKAWASASFTLQRESTPLRARGDFCLPSLPVMSFDFAANFPFEREPAPLAGPEDIFLPSLAEVPLD
jgi:hypothetical protein